ncbi:hypothetical protein SUGI_0274140 [Cryptomeria japonica]|uniref:methionine S-methyltransferase isoform X1 n=1 Tax=Cryptomeria japonica TaxID=3369 RepID=UPI002408A080|nr:methionine S-methyltransferase isoform X1 [Cryptomeria japonica]GLJ16280.1 hypothetical protein SUGI_0274140 [Cryptomeria japonica]
MELKGTGESEVEAFLAECRRSGDGAYNAIKGILERLDNVESRKEARVFLASVQRHIAATDSHNRLSIFHFNIHDLSLSSYEGFQQNRKKLTMMELPSIFIPEDWSFTFFEGINRYPDSMFKDRTVTELGCGNGWISIALAEKWSPQKVYGLDINPRAVKVARINLYLNSLDENGFPIYDDEGKTLLERVEFHESDLLSYCREHNIMVDRIVACIPQILNPNPEAMSKLITENASEEFLYSLSNYCALQGFVEDQFGLGLIARAAEEGITSIRPMGRMIFNIGGRPGQAVCERLFERRGFRISKLWQTKVTQAADTDISALVEIEKGSRHRFEFFMGLVSDEPICARTAWAYAKSGGPISHALSVYSCELRQPNHVKTIFNFLKKGFHEASSALDLSFKDDLVADEKIPFLGYLAKVLEEHSFFPYEPPAGSTRFRNLIVHFMRIYHHIPLTPDNIVIFPSRSVAIEHALRLFSPCLALVDQNLTRNLPKQWLTSLSIQRRTNEKCGPEAVTVIEAPHRSDVMIELIKKLKPQIVVTGIADFEAKTSSAFEQLLDATRLIGSRLFLDMSDHLELSSLPGTNGILKYLATNALPSHASILCGLVKNQVYTDLEVAFVISESEEVYTSLAKTMELLQSRTPLFSQYYYGCLFHELLNFQLPDRHQTAKRFYPEEYSGNMIGIADSAVKALQKAELSNLELRDVDVIHLDLDQSSLTVPSTVKEAVFESFARQNIIDAETDLGLGIEDFVKGKFGFPADQCNEIFLGDSALALFTKLVLVCMQEGGTLCFPTGCNGNYVYAAEFLKASIARIPTSIETSFKLTDKIVEQFLGSVERPWLYISGPTINPTGLIYTSEEICSILLACEKYGARVILDTSFSGLEFETTDSRIWNLESVLLKSLNPSFSLSLLGGSSFEMLTGGLEFGYLIMTHMPLIEAFKDFPCLSRPHGTIKYTIKKLLTMCGQKSNVLLEAICEQKQILKKRFEQMKKMLLHCGWEVIDSSGGVSMVARPIAYEGKTIHLKQPLNNGINELKLDGDNIREAMMRTAGLCINSSLWTGIPGYCRFALALDDAGFQKALQSLGTFKNYVFENSL